MLYPYNTGSRTVMDLSGTWDFALDDGTGTEQGWYRKKLPGTDHMPVPSSYNDLKEEEKYREHYGIVFYQRRISVADFLRGQRIMLRVGAAPHSAVIYLNGEEICRHKGGFLPFETEIGSRMQEGENLLTIAVDNRIDRGTLPVGAEDHGIKAMIGGSMQTLEATRIRNVPQFDFFNYSGLIRPVLLYTTPQQYIADVTMVSSVKQTKENHFDAILSWKMELSGSEESGDRQEDATQNSVRIEICDQEHKKIAETTAVVTNGHAEGTIKISNVNLWQPGNAYLYQIKCNLMNAAGKKIDDYTLPYGIRTVEVTGNTFLINGKPFYFKGFGKHEDTFPAGRGINAAMNAKDISLMKWIGANSFRTSHYPYSEEMMQLCDEEGIVVIDETPAVGLHLNFGGGADFRGGKKVRTFDKAEDGGVKTFSHHQEVIHDLIGRDKNHACVVMWSIANEPDSAGEGAYEYFKPLFDQAHREDPQNRPCTLVTMSVADNSKDCTLRLSDVICLNRYYGWYIAGGDLDAAEKLMRKEMDFWQAQGKPFMFTEYGADTIMGFHDTVPAMFTEEYQVAYYEMNDRVADDYSNFIGEQVWNFADFATSQGIMRIQGNKKGIFTRDRRPKQAAFFLKERWHAIPDFGYKKQNYETE